MTSSTITAATGKENAASKFPIGQAEYKKLSAHALEQARDFDIIIAHNDEGLAVVKDGDFLADDCTFREIERWLDGYQQHKFEVEDASATTEPSLYLPLYNKSVGEVYVGMTLMPDGTPEHHIILLDSNSTAPLTWLDAIGWADEQGGRLPNMRELALVVLHGKALLDDVVYWSDDQDREDGDYIQCLNSVSGKQLKTPAASRNAAVVIRRVEVRFTTEGTSEQQGGVA